MALFRGGGLNEGSLLRRTLLHIGTFAFGSLAVVTLLSFLLVSIAKSVLPSRAPKDAAKEQATEESTDGASTSAKTSSSKTGKPKRPRGSITEEESPTRASDTNE